MDIQMRWPWQLLSRNVQADQMKIPILVDAEPERTREELGGLLSLASYIVCNGKFPEVCDTF
jgi:hypothetical protein